MTHEATVMDLFLADWEKVKANPTPGNLRNFGAVLALFVQEYNRAEGALADRDRLAAEVERLAPNAARYEWLRSRLPGSSYRIAGVIYSEGGQGVDAAIDAQIAAAGKDGRG